MTKIKLCGLSRICDIEAANELFPEYIGFVFAPKSKRYIHPEQARQLKCLLAGNITAVGVFVNERPELIAQLLNDGVVDAAQLHGNESDSYIASLRKLTNKPVIRAFKVKSAEDIAQCESCCADGILLDSGAGTGNTFDWEIVRNIRRPYFLAGGLNPENVAEAVRRLSPFAVDVSSGIETNGLKDIDKMAAFVTAVRKEDKL